MGVIFLFLLFFQLWDVKECCKIDSDFKALNSIGDCIHLILAYSNSEVNYSKRPHLGNVGGSVGIGNDVGDDMQLEPTARELEPMEIRLTYPVSTVKVAISKEHSCTDGEALKSTLLPQDVLH